MTSCGDLVRLNIKIVAKLYPVNNVLTTELFCIFLAKDMATIGKIGSKLRLVPGYRPKGDAKLPTEFINNTKGGIVSFSVKIKVSAIFFWGGGGGKFKSRMQDQALIG